MKHLHFVLASLLLNSVPCLGQEEPRARDYGNKTLIECDQLPDDQWESSLAKLATVPMGEGSVQLIYRTPEGVMKELKDAGLSPEEQKSALTDQYIVVGKRAL